MAYGTRWSISFKTILGRFCTISIMQDGWTGTATELTPADNPFETQENDNRDPFTPRRGQTGKINVVSNDPDLVKSIMPSSDTQHPVVLRINGSIGWMGFLQTAAYSQPFDLSANKITLPVISVLQALDSIPFNGFYGRTMAIDNILKEIFSKAGITLTDTASDTPYMYFLTELADQAEFLHTQVCCSLFYNVSATIENGNPIQLIESMSCGEVLDALLTPFGLCIRESGKNFYVGNAVRNYHSTVFNAQRYNFTSRTFSYGSDTFGFSLISNYDQYIAANMSKQNFSPGAKSVAVSLSISDTKIVDTNLPETPFSTNSVVGGNILNDDGEKEGVTYVQPIDTPSQQRRTLWTETLRQARQWFMRRRESGDTSFSSSDSDEVSLADSSAFHTDMLTHESTQNPEVYTISGVVGCCLCRVGEGQEYNNLKLEPGLLINSINAQQKAYHWSASQSDSFICYSLHSNNIYTFKGGRIVLQLEYKCMQYFQRGYIDGYVPRVRCYIGNTEIYPWSEKGWAVTSEISGQLRVQIDSGWPYPYPAFEYKPITYIIKELRLFWDPGDGEITMSDASSNVYKNLINRNFAKDVQVSTTLGTVNNNKPSVSFMLDEDSNFKETFTFTGNRIVRPESYLLSALKKQYSYVQQEFSRTYRANIFPTNPLFFYEDDDNLIYTAIVSRHKWRDDEVERKYLRVING